MKKITWTWKKILSLILGFLGIGTLTSCYGMIPMDPNEIPIDFAGIVIGDIEDDDINDPVPIPGIKVSLFSYETNTDSDGYFSFSLPPSDKYPIDYEIIFEDVDDEKNGSFKNTTKTGTILYPGIGEWQEITLEKK